jgi:hypothetical protein
MFMTHKFKKPLLYVVKLWGDEPLTPEYIRLLKIAREKNISTGAGSIQTTTRSMRDAIKSAEMIKEHADNIPYPFMEGMTGAVVKGDRPIHVFTSGVRSERTSKNYIRDLKAALKKDKEARKGMI